MTLSIERAVLVYQGGIANVFSVDCFNMSEYGRKANRLIQGDFRTCESFARGMVAAGVIVTSAHCNRAGEIKNNQWDSYLEDAPFRNEFRPVYSKHVQGYRAA